jgi:hypothetical protein
MKAEYRKNCLQRDSVERKEHATVVDRVIQQAISQ